MKCVLCGGTVFSVVTNKLRFNILRKVVRCDNCLLVSLENPTKDVVDYSESAYRELHSPILGKAISPKELFDIQTQFHQKRIERVKSLLTHDANILEIGCSTGHFLNAIKSLVSKVVGIELDPRHASFARENCHLEVYEQDIGKAPLPKNNFDVIFMFQVFEHVPAPLEFLTLCKKYLKSSGTIYLEIPNVNDALLSVYEIPAFKDFYYRAPHPYYYSENTLAKMLHKAGFIGTTRTVQEYTLFNHIHWLLTGRPQASQKDGQSPLEWTCLNSARKEDEMILKCWFDKINEEYKNLLEKRGIAEILCYQGKSSSA